MSQERSYLSTLGLSSRYRVTSCGLSSTSCCSGEWQYEGEGQLEDSMLQEGQPVEVEGA